MKPVCPKCGSQRFLFDSRFQSYICRSCKYCDSSMLLPSEMTDYKRFLKFFNHALKENQIPAAESKEVKEFTYDDFKQFISKFLKENQQDNTKTETKKTVKKRTTKKKS